MDAEQLTQLQAPLKARYKADPSAALVTLRAAGHVVQESVTFVLDTGKPGVPVGLHPAAGGDGSAACSGDMLLEALVGCAGVTLAAVATAMGIELDTASVAAEGELDFRGTLGVTRDTPVGFSQIRLLFSIQTATAADKVHKLVELTERYCVILQTLAHSPSVQVVVSTVA
jgi:uncharacterized OsmC-like protein